MNPSLYQGESRAVPRWTVVGMLMLVVVVITGTLLFESQGVHSVKDPPWILQPPFLFRPLAAALGLFSLYAMLQFGRQRSPLKWGLAALASLAYLKESQLALTGYEIRDVYICGALFGGWLFGVVFQHAIDDRLERPYDRERDDAMGEAAATGIFAAVYLGAFVSKLIDSGIGWGDGANLLVTMVQRHRFAHSGGWLDSYLLYIVDHPALATGFAMSTMIIQGGMFLYILSPRLRMVWGTLIISFHMNALLLMGVRYIEPMILSLVLSYPWPKIVRILRGGQWGAVPFPEAQPSDEEVKALSVVARRAVKWATATGAVTLVLWFAIHLHDRKHLILDQGIFRINNFDNGTGNRNGVPAPHGQYFPPGQLVPQVPNSGSPPGPGPSPSGQSGPSNPSPPPAAPENH